MENMLRLITIQKRKHRYSDQHLLMKIKMVFMTSTFKKAYQKLQILKTMCLQLCLLEVLQIMLSKKMLFCIQKQKKIQIQNTESIQIRFHKISISMGNLIKILIHLKFTKMTMMSVKMMQDLLFLRKIKKKSLY